WPWSIAVRSTYQISLLTAGPSPDESFAVAANIFQLPSFKANDEFLAYVQKQLSDDPQIGRFENLGTHVESYDQTCVKYTHSAKDFGAKRGGTFTIYETYGMECIHPKNPRVGVRIELSRKAPPAV